MKEYQDAVDDRNGSVEPAETVVQDIVTRLLALQTGPRRWSAVRLDAIAEIERLRELGDSMAYMMRYGGDRGWDEAIDAWQEARRD